MCGCNINVTVVSLLHHMHTGFHALRVCVCVSACVYDCVGGLVLVDLY